MPYIDAVARKNIQRFKEEGNLARLIVDICEQVRKSKSKDFTFQYAELVTVILAEFPEDKIRDFVIRGLFNKEKK